MKRKGRNENKRKKKNNKKERKRRIPDRRSKGSENGKRSEENRVILDQ